MAKHGLTPRDLADKASATDQAARYWVSGSRKPTPKRCRALRDALGIPMAVLRPDLFATDHGDELQAA